MGDPDGFGPGPQRTAVIVRDHPDDAAPLGIRIRGTVTESRLAESGVLSDRRVAVRPIGEARLACPSKAWICRELLEGDVLDVAPVARPKTAATTACPSETPASRGSWSFDVLLVANALRST
jgi:hypothetical protein